jgi:hypothetical protein
MNIGSRDRSVGIATRLRAGRPPIQWVPGALSLGVKRPEHEVDHSPPSSAEVKNAWSYTSIPLYVFMAWCLVKHRDNFTFFTFTTASRQALGPTQTPIQCIPVTPSHGVKRLGRETHHSPPSSAKVKKCVALYLYSPYVFRAWY